MKKMIMKRVLSSVMALSMMGSLAVLAQAASAPQPPETGDNITWYQNEDYQGDISWFDVSEYAGNDYMGTKSVLKKVKDPADPDGDNYVLMGATVGKTDTTKFPENSAISLYQGELQPVPSKQGIVTPESLDLKGYLVFETKAYFEKELNDYIKSAYCVYFQPSRDNTSYHQYAMADDHWIQGKGDHAIIAPKYKKISYDTWNTWKYVYDCETKEAWFYLNDELYYNGIITSYTPAINVGIRFFSRGTLIPENLLYFDDTKCYNYVPAAGTEVSFNSATGKVDITFKTEVPELTEANVVLKNNGEAVALNEVISGLTLTEDKLSASFDVDLTKLNGNNYTVTLSGLKDRFAQDITIDELSLVLPDAGAVVESVDYDAKAVRLRFATAVNGLAKENIVIKENGETADSRVISVTASEGGDYADVTLDMSNIGAAQTTIGLTGVTDVYGQAVDVQGTAVIEAPELLFDEMSIENENATFTFNQKMSAAAAENVIVTNQTGDEVLNAISAVTIADKKVTVKLSDKVKFGRDYTIAFNNIKDEYSSTISVPAQNYSAVLCNVLYDDDYSTLNPDEFDTMQQFGKDEAGTDRNDLSKSFIAQTEDPLNPGNKVATVYSTGKTDKRYPYITAMAIAKTELMDKLNNLASGNKTDNYICYETDMYLSSDLLSKGSIYIGVGPRADGYNAYPMFFNTLITSNGTNFVYKSTDTTDIKGIAFNADAWNNFKFVIDHKNGYVSLFINDKPSYVGLKGSNMQYTDSSCAGITIWCSGAKSQYLIPENKIFFDNTKVYELRKRSGVTEIRPDSYTRSVEIEFNTPVTEDALNKIRIYDESGEVDGAIGRKTISSDGYVAELFFTDSLIADKTYEINFDSDIKDMYNQPMLIDNGTYTYVVPKSKSIFITDNSISCVFDGSGIPTVSFKANSYDPESSAWIGIGFYDKYNSLIDYAADTVSALTEEKEFSYTLDKDCSEAVKYGLFVWDGIETMVPLQRAEFTEISR